jgi:hypothetical protein
MVVVRCSDAGRNFSGGRLETVWRAREVDTETLIYLAALRGLDSMAEWIR